MKMGRLTIYSLILLASLLGSGCITIEKEIFLNPDGSGEMVLHVSVPDLPESMASSKPGKTPEEEIQGFKRDILNGLSPNVKLKEVKEVKQNGAHGFYAVVQFKDIKDVESALATFGKGSLTDGEVKGDSEWKLRLDKLAGANAYTESFFVDMRDAKVSAGVKAEGDAKVEMNVSGPAPKSRRAARGKRSGAVKPAPAQGPPAGGAPSESISSEMSASLDKQLKPLLLSLIKMRFVLHAPGPIASSNADIILNDRIAIWNASFAAFAKEKKPIIMKATY